MDASVISMVSQECKQLGFEEAYAFARSLEPTPNLLFPGLAAVGNPNAALLFTHRRACSSVSAAIRTRHGMPGSEDEHAMIFEWAVLIAQNFHPISDLSNVNPRLHAKRSDARNYAMRHVELSKAIDEWIDRARSGGEISRAAVMLNLACRHDLRARLRKLGIEDDVFDAVEDTLVRSQPLTAAKVIGWCNAIKGMLLKTGPHGRHVGLIIVADTAARAFLHFKKRKGGPDSGVLEDGFRPGSYMGWSFDIACFAFPDLSDREGVSTWKSVNRHVEANPSDADRWLDDNGLNSVRQTCLPWLP